jgi:hypothetical protein
VKPFEKIREEKRLLKQKLLSELSGKLNEICLEFSEETGCVVSNVSFRFLEISTMGGPRKSIVEYVDVNADII